MLAIAMNTASLRENQLQPSDPSTPMTSHRESSKDFQTTVDYSSLNRQRELLLQQIGLTEDKLSRAKEISENRRSSTRSSQLSRSPSNYEGKSCISLKEAIRNELGSRVHPVNKASLPKATPMKGAIIRFREKEVLRACGGFSDSGCSQTVNRKALYGDCTF